METRRGERQRYRGRGLLIALLLLTTGVCALLGGEGGGASRVLWCFCSLFQVPLLFFALGGWSRERAPTVGQAGRLGAGFALLCGAEKALLFWAGALGGAGPEFDLLPAADASWIFLALALCLPLGTWLDRFSRRGLILACAGLAGCAGGCWAAQGEFFGLGRFLAFFPLFLLGRWTDWMALSRLLKRRWVQLLSAALLAAALVLCGLAAGPLYQMRGLFLGDGAVSGLWGGLLRAAQYAVALVLGGGILVLLPRRRTPLLSAVGSAGSLSGSGWARCLSC